MIREILRKWLFPEIQPEGNTDDPISVSILTKKLMSMREILNMMHGNAMKEIDAKMGSMFFMYPVKKKIPVKMVLRELLDHFDLEVVVYKDVRGEFVPRIEEKMYRYTEKMAE